MNLYLTNYRLGIPSTPCNEDCNCQANRFAPACSEDGQVNFFSACHAGCTRMNTTEDQTVIQTLINIILPFENVLFSTV